MKNAFQPPPLVKLPEIQRLICQYANREVKAGRLGMSVSSYRAIDGVNHHFLVIDRHTTYADLHKMMVAMATAVERKQTENHQDTKARKRKRNRFVAWCLCGWNVAIKSVGRIFA